MLGKNQDFSQDLLTVIGKVIYYKCCLLLTQCSILNPPENVKKTFGSLTFSGGTKIEHWTKMDKTSTNINFPPPDQ